MFTMRTLLGNKIKPKKSEMNIMGRNKMIIKNDTKYNINTCYSYYIPELLISIIIYFELTNELRE